MVLSIRMSCMVGSVPLDISSFSLLVVGYERNLLSMLPHPSPLIFHRDNN